MLTLLLDENISPVVAEQAVLKNPEARILSIHHWHGGEYLSVPDELILEIALQEEITLVTFDQSTIRPVLKAWGEVGRSHGGVFFIDEKSIAQNDYGTLVRALLTIWERMANTSCENVVLFRQR
ncbi:MAG: DUF5615 family PIN-like protein [Armatimonadetes bacterium]|nr:DUF5615 family PIN-like protein [Armatimonadota bacterium]